MVKLFLLLLLPLLLNASKILSYNIYDRTDRVDIMITFDTPYTGKIRQSISASKIIIKLENASIESTKSKLINSQFLSSINITPLATYTKITAVVPSSVLLKASKTSDSYGLRLRFSKTTTSKNTAQNTGTKFAPNSLSSLPTKEDSSISTNYYIVIAILFIGIIILFTLKNKMSIANSKEKSNSWLFKTANHSNKQNADGVSIRFQKNIDSKNTVVMLDFVGQSYLLLMGTNNILLDKFTDNKPNTQDDFDSILQNRHEELNDFLNENEEKDPMEIYKEKAANISYTV
ncbi:MAG: hypothetical protein JKY28_04225 [Sulfurimonas sp.]|nr:hypothetical protein [Sulfurimonas sp.]PHQ92444.1 MAG: hypothetical protein COB42_01535 [Sulfurimonas sp.]